MGMYGGGQTFGVSGGSPRALLVQTRSSFISNDDTKERGGRNLTGIMLYLVIALCVILFIVFEIEANANASATLVVQSVAVVIIIFSPAFIYAGWRDFSLYQLIAGIPTSKVAGAAEGLNEIVARFVPEKGDPVIAGISKTKCAACAVSIYAREQMGRTTVEALKGSYIQGTTSILADETGYIAIDPYNADFKLNSTSSWFLVDKNDKIVTEFDPLGAAIISKFMSSPGMTLDEMKKMGVDISNSPKFRLLSNGQMSVAETTIPLDRDFFAMGRVGGTTKEFKSKVVKKIFTDPSSKLLSLREESRKGIVSEDRALSYVSFAIGAALLLVGIYLLVAAA